MVNLRSLLASTTNNNLQGPNMPKYGFAVLMFFLFSFKDMCLLDIICYVANPENAVKESRGIIRQGPSFDHIVLQ